VKIQAKKRKSENSSEKKRLRNVRESQGMSGKAAQILTKMELCTKPYQCHNQELGDSSARGRFGKDDRLYGKFEGDDGGELSGEDA